MDISNRQFTLMLDAAKQRLARHAPAEIARRADAHLDGTQLKMKSLGRFVTVNFQDFSISPALDSWHTLTLLHYLDLADGTPLSGRMMPFGQYADGMVRGGGFDRDAEAIIQSRLGTLPPDTLRQRCLRLGAELIPSNADFCARFDFLPRYPLWLRLWFADEEFPASGRLLVDESAPHYLTIEDAVTVGSLLLDRLAGTQLWR